MLRHRLHMFGKTIPTWLLVLTLVVAGAGAAVGTVLAGKITGEIPVTVGQALQLYQAPTQATGIYAADKFIGTMSDDGTAFTAAAELNTGDEWRFYVYTKNVGDNPLVGELTLVYPDGLTLEVSGDGNVVKNVTRTGLYTWKFDHVSSAGGASVFFEVKVGVADDIAPGFYKIDGTIKQVAY